MNIIFLQGEITSYIEFKFIYNSKNISIVKFYIKLIDNTQILVKAYNELADYIYANCKIEDFINIIGRFEEKNIVIEEIEIY